MFLHTRLAPFSEMKIRARPIDEAISVRLA